MVGHRPATLVREGACAFAGVAREERDGSLEFEGEAEADTPRLFVGEILSRDGVQWAVAHVRYSAPGTYLWAMLAPAAIWSERLEQIRANAAAEVARAQSLSGSAPTLPDSAGAEREAAATSPRTPTLSVVSPAEEKTDETEQEDAPRDGGEDHEDEAGG